VHEDPVVVGRLEVVRELEGDLAADDAVGWALGWPPEPTAFLAVVVNS